MGSYKYFFYDMDDTLVYTKDIWTNAIIQYLKHRGLSYADATVYKYLGKNCRDICNDITRDFQLACDENTTTCNEELRQLLQYEFDRVPPKEIPGANCFIQTMGSYVRQFVVSGSSMYIIGKVLEEQRWRPLIEDFVSSESVSHGKPNPEIYNLLRTRLHADPTECLIFEDSPAGIEAACSAGITCVVINPKFPTAASQQILTVAKDFDSLFEDRMLIELIMSRHQ